MSNLYKRKNDQYREQLAWLKYWPDGVLYRAESAFNQIFVVKAGNEIRLRYADLADWQGRKLSPAMSCIDLDEPIKLLASYTQTIMNFLIWNPKPRRIFIIGLGGGNLELLLHSIFPKVKIETADLDPELPYVAERYFGLTFDERQKIAIQDGRRYLESQPKNKKYDLIVVDAFMGCGNPIPDLQTAEFYGLCKQHLSNNGVVAVNMVEPESSLRFNIETFNRNFSCCYIYNRSEMCVLFGGNLERITSNVLMERAINMQQQYQFTFPFLQRADSVRLLIKPGVLAGVGLRNGINYRAG